MSYTTITASVRDDALQDRVLAAAMTTAFANPEFEDTEFGRLLKLNPVMALNTFMWPVAVDYRAEYEFAINNDNPNPGGDVGVISDANIEASVQVHWPDGPVNAAQPPDPTLEVPDGD